MVMGNTSLNDDSPHPLIVFGGNACQELTAHICGYLDIEVGRCQNKSFPNGETMVRMDDDVRGYDVFVVVSVCRQCEPLTNNGYSGINDCLMELLVFGDALRRASAQRITAVVPHFGYARQDRKTIGRTPISARLMADLIVQAGFNRVLTMDLHADQIQGFFPREVPLDHLNAGKLFADYFTSLDLSNAVVLSADAGNIKKADKYRRGFPPNVELAMIDKRRDTEGNVRAVHLIGDVAGMTVFMLDDIVSTASTVDAAIRIAIEHGAKEFYLAATHGEFVGKAVVRLKDHPIKQVIVTDTIPMLDNMSELPMHVLSVAELFGEAIRRIHQYESISELLGAYG